MGRLPWVEAPAGHGAGRATGREGTAGRARLLRRWPGRASIVRCNRDGVAMAAIETPRFLQDLHDLRKIGQYRTGVHRPTYSPQDMEARRWLVARLEECGLEAGMDGIGNVYGRHLGPGPHLLVGSHIESQNHAGWLDGALGVVAGVALARAGLPVDVC